MGVVYSKENAELLLNPAPAKKNPIKRLLKFAYKIVMEISKKITPLRKLLRKITQIRRAARYNKIRDSIATDDKTVLFSTFDGRNYSDSPKAIYLRMLENPQYKDYKLVWAFRKPENHIDLLENPNTYIVKTNTPAFEEMCATAKYWFFNHRVADHIYPKDDQVYTQLWHGTPLKRLGYDIKTSDNAMNTKAEIRDKYRIDAEKFKYILAPSQFAAEKFESAWNLKEFGKTDALLVAGYPRNDFLINYTDEQARKIKEKLNLPEDKKIILYAPTWRDNQYKAGVGYTYSLDVDFDYLREQLEDEYIILFRAHYFVASQFDFAKYEGFVYNASTVDDVNDLYVISDLLITDYSSVFFDFANLNRPILFYMYDLADYGNEIRGFYIDLKELPGNIVETQEALAEKIKAVKYDTGYYTEKYKNFHNKFNPLDDGKAADRVLETVVK